MRIVLLFFSFFFFINNIYGQIEDPFSVDIQIKEKYFFVYVNIPDNHYLYADYFKVLDSNGIEILSENAPSMSEINDSFSGSLKKVYNKNLKISFLNNPEINEIVIKYWGCSDTTCFIPQQKIFFLGKKTELKLQNQPHDEKYNLSSYNLDIKRKEVGYLNPKSFINFLKNNKVQNPGISYNFKEFINNPVIFLEESSTALSIIFILIGGLALNLTPCILPMIPVNLAIIGAGSKGKNKKTGFILGSFYGLGIAFVYGILGVIVVLTGSQFGIFNANPWFNLIVAIIFLILSLSIFDIFQIDFSRFERKKENINAGKISVALCMGMLSGLLAGACVAPVVIAVLVLSVDIYAVNPILGISLPFILGLGMALPWPFAGAGLSFLPKPGKWMQAIKVVFGVFIIILSIYYGSLSWNGFKNQEESRYVNSSNIHIVSGMNNVGLEELFAQASNKNKPILIDFWADWCKSCKAMDKQTFEDPRVKKELENFIVIKYIANDVQKYETKKILEIFNVQGLPTYVVIE